MDNKLLVMGGIFLIAVIAIAGAIVYFGTPEGQYVGQFYTASGEQIICDDYWNRPTECTAQGCVWTRWEEIPGAADTSDLDGWCKEPTEPERQPVPQEDVWVRPCDELFGEDQCDANPDCLYDANLNPPCYDVDEQGAEDPADEPDDDTPATDGSGDGTMGSSVEVPADEVPADEVPVEVPADEEEEELENEVPVEVPVEEENVLLPDRCNDATPCRAGMECDSTGNCRVVTPVEDAAQMCQELGADGDILNLRVRGQIIDEDGELHSDMCINEDNVRKYYCLVQGDNKVGAFENYKCPPTMDCVEGACE
jgi:hypothetical protein